LGVELGETTGERPRRCAGAPEHRRERGVEVGGVADRERGIDAGGGEHRLAVGRHRRRDRDRSERVVGERQPRFEALGDTPLDVRAAGEATRAPRRGSVTKAPRRPETADGGEEEPGKPLGRETHCDTF